MSTLPILLQTRTASASTCCAREHHCLASTDPPNLIRGHLSCLVSFRIGEPAGGRPRAFMNLDTLGLGTLHAQLINYGVTLGCIAPVGPTDSAVA